MQARQQSRERGYTLIELGVTVAIMALMLSVVAVPMTGVRKGATYSALAEDMQAIFEAAHKFYAMERTDSPGAPGYINLFLVAAGSPIRRNLPPSFSGLNPINASPYFVVVEEFGADVLHRKAQFDSGWVTRPRVRVYTCVPNDDAADIAAQDSWGLTNQASGLCPGMRRIRLERVAFPASADFQAMVLKDWEEDNL